MGDLWDERLDLAERLAQYDYTQSYLQWLQLYLNGLQKHNQMFSDAPTNPFAKVHQ